ncbi:MAG: DUF992 domain-containing protein [Pseudolabrys sp.]
MTKAAIGVTAIALAATLLGAVTTQARDPGKVGTLDCDVSGGVGLIVTSKKSMTCRFVPTPGGAAEIYTGTISKFGLDIGGTTGGRMVWTVVAPGSPARGALAGNYGGASAEATVAAGLGANVLVGGSRRTIALQPLSVQGQSGLNFAVGVSELTLRAL